MGLIRWLLAIAVLVTHSEQILGFHFLGGSAAVRTFFMISGFYMTLILNRKYLKLENGYRLFITNRFLRLYPIYWIVFLVTLCVCLLGYVGFHNPYLLTPYVTQSHNLNLLAWGLVIVSNLIIFLQASLSFVDFYQGHIFITRTHPVAVPGWQFLLVPQAWSIGLELTFYSVAPFFVGRSLRFVVLLIAAAAGSLALIYLSGLTVGAWGQRFFISGFVHFACGALTYKLYEAYLKKYFTKAFATVLLVAWVVTTVDNNLLPGDVGYWIYFVQSFVSIPFVFNLSKDWKWDRFIGEFSYPVYLSHYVVIGIMSFIFARYHWSQSWLGEAALVATMAGSFLLLKFVSVPIDRIREDRVARGRNKTTVAQTDALNDTLAATGQLKGVVNADKQL